MRKWTITAVVGILAMSGLATSSVAGTVRASDSLPNKSVSKRIAVRAGQTGSEKAGGGLSSTEVIVGGLVIATVVGGIIIATSSKSP